MDIALLNVRVVFQKSAVVVDAIGNHKNEWTEFYSCYATVSGENGKETTAAGITVDDSDLSFSVRYCLSVSEINNTEYRVLFGGEIYNILSVDHMNYRNKSVKFKCQKVRR
ncbi:phage head closure protein [Hespellia stercorisuis]|jgi:SPP1 family predicted phage head-tail adaptor|uniref:Phage head-tail adaptor, putative, SPP1 family n=1 Tax=Hespellia stercorisuis DSM 15480 TaxID=1121950 RepID=A0A1M6IPC3_9FIRM|nr:phage head closure protein [Hespellia stercorisuis]SHJ36283.1 phage head-tail adaptor, putative, SPP1 family [Hespellia stercorisuis DSM 15480]